MVSSVKSDSREKEDDDRVSSTTKENKESIDDEIFNIVSLIVQWFLVLDQIRYERASEAYFSDSRSKCQCAKARDIVEKCTSAKHDLSLILKNQTEKNDRGGRDLQNSVSRLMTMIRNHRPIVSSVKTALQNSNSKVANKVGDFLETKGFGQ